MTLSSPEKECPELPDPDNGQVHLSGRHFQDQAVYTCDRGYTMVGASKRVCQTSGQWSGSIPQCKHSASGPHSPYYCSYPPTIEDASHNAPEEQSYYDLDTELSYQCFDGFRPHREQVGGGEAGTIILQLTSGLRSGEVFLYKRNCHLVWT